MPHKYNLRKRRKIVYYNHQNWRLNRAAFLFFTSYIWRFDALQVIHVVDAETQTVRGINVGTQTNYSGFPHADQIQLTLSAPDFHGGLEIFMGG